jgi:hypothetical protein
MTYFPCAALRCLPSAPFHANIIAFVLTPPPPPPLATHFERITHHDGCNAAVLSALTPTLPGSPPALARSFARSLAHSIKHARMLAFMRAFPAGIRRRRIRRRRGGSTASRCARALARFGCLAVRRRATGNRNRIVPIEYYSFIAVRRCGSPRTLRYTVEYTASGLRPKRRVLSCTNRRCRL